MKLRRAKDSSIEGSPQPCEVSAPSASVPGGGSSTSDATTTAPLAHGLVKQARAVDPIVALPAGIREVRRATPADAEAIAAIQDQYQLRKIDAADHPQNGWLVQKSTPDAIRFSMQHYKAFWVAVDDSDRIVAFQAISAPRYLSRPVDKHKFFGPFAKRARDLIQQAKFIYMSQIATAPGLRGKGLAAAMQASVLKHYKHHALLAHVAVFTQLDFDAWDGDKARFEPRSNNVVSHRYHQRQGYVPVAWTGDIVGSAEYNSGLPPPDPKGPPAVVGVLYINFRDGAESVTREYIDPVRAVLDSPCREGESTQTEWQNPFPSTWPDQTYDLNFDEGSFFPNPWGLGDYFRQKELDELRALEKGRSDG